VTTILVAATGGHLTQLDRLAPRIPGYDEDALWVTFDSPQSRSLLRDRRHTFVPYVSPRDYRGTVRVARRAGRIVRSIRPTLVVSTGNAVAMSFLPVARALGYAAAYVESAARAEGPSLTGALLERTPGVQLFSQYESWADPPWRYAGSVFDEFAPAVTRAPRLRRVVVTLGTIRDYSFQRLLQRLVDMIPTGCEVLWQVGATPTDYMPIDPELAIPAHELEARMVAADAVVAHAGSGAALTALEAGRCPVLVPREAAHSEHVDDHQSQIAAELERRGLALHRSVEDLELADLLTASRRTVTRVRDLPQLPIDTRAGGRTAAAVAA
jgi:UDP-N-acetylglucosamine--N-acetylmuramyl-(pentapeptide) pyrophosphoryl-undecaprenol N-acetylglucosamine transferase